MDAFPPACEQLVDLADGALNAVPERLMLEPQLLQLLVAAVGRGWSAGQRGLDPGKRPLDPADGEDGAFIWHQGRNSTAGAPRNHAAASRTG